MNKRKPILGTWQVTLPKAYSACRVPKIGFFMINFRPSKIQSNFIKSILKYPNKRWILYAPRLSGRNSFMRLLKKELVEVNSKSEHK